MRCRYCFYHDLGGYRQTRSYGIMTVDTMDRIIGNVYRDLNPRDEITFAFQGGEPALAGLDWFGQFTEKAAALTGEVKVHYALQTNGLLLNDAWASFLKENDFLVGLSIDGGKKFHDQNRPNAAGEGTFDACIQSKNLLEKYGVPYNILCVLTNELAADPDKAWRFIKEEKIGFIQFIPCLEGLDEQKPSAFALRPARFASFYSRLYYWWMKELEKGSYISIKLFDDTAHLFFNGIPAACGIDGRCRPQYVVEADGSTYPCDFYALDNYHTGNLRDHTLHELFDTEIMQAFLKESRNLPKLCLSCPYLNLCNGGCKRMRGVMYYGDGGTLCGYKTFLDKCLKPLEYTVQKHFTGAGAGAKPLS
jgi:uncharacterized protein